MLALDLHTHTRFFHGHPALAERYDPYGHRLLSGVARLRGLDGVALTNHDYYRPLGDPAGDGSFASIPGNEISTTEGHVLVIGPDPPTTTEPNALTPEDAVELAHDRGCVAIVAHPYRNSTVRESDAPFDAIEVNGKHPRTWPLVEEIAEHRDLPLVGGSDAHYPIEAGRAYTAVDADDATPGAVVDAIRDGRVEPRVNQSRLNRALRDAYGRIHARKGYVDPAELSERLEEGSPCVE